MVMSGVSVKLNELRIRDGNGGDSNDELAGRLKALEISNAVVLPFALKAFVRLGVPKILRTAGPGAKLTAREIAESIPAKGGELADIQHLGIILRVLVAHNVLTEELTERPDQPTSLERQYSPTSALKFLMSTEDAEDGDSLALLLNIMTDSILVLPLQFIHERVLDRTAEPFVLAHGKKLFELLSADQELSRVFNLGYACNTELRVKSLLEHEQYRGFEGLSTIVDVGGGVGKALTMILEKYPNLKGINFDLPSVVTNGVQAPGLKHIGGNFFESVPKADAVFMKILWFSNVLHNWSDEHCMTILRNIERALPPHGKIINVDVVLPEAIDSSPVTRINLCNSVLMMDITIGGY